MPWWVWLILGLWCGPGIHCTFVLLTHKSIPYMPEEGELIKPKLLPLPVRILIFPLLLVVLLVAWPLFLWPEVRESRRSVKILMFPIYLAFVMAAWPLYLWRDVRGLWLRQR